MTASPTARSGRCSTTASTWPSSNGNSRGGYARVNRRFADTLLPLIEPDDLVWVHDYHLIPLGTELRMRDMRNAWASPAHALAADAAADGAPQPSRDRLGPVRL